ncbi:MAG: LysR family transcriptional regulator [Spirochaetales bacterium]|nr:LysR family transcriptional regulator [Spirochaetales bacterium]
MNFQNLEYFLTVASEGNITRAAEQLHVSQQALSNQISRLESELGCRLFERKQGLELTYAGEQFRISAEKILDIQRQTATELDDISNNRRGELRIGISHTRGQAILPLILPKFSRLYPEVDLHVNEGSTHILEEHLQKGRIDVLIGFAPFMVDCAEYRPLMTEHLFLIIPRNLLSEHFGDMADDVLESYRSKPDIKLFKDLPFVLLRVGDRIRTIVDREFYRNGITPKIRIETQNIQTAFALASEGMGITVCPQLYLESPFVISGYADSEARHDVEILNFSSKDLVDSIAIAYNRERYLSRIASDFIDMTLKEFGK